MGTGKDTGGAGATESNEQGAPPNTDACSNASTQGVQIATEKTPQRPAGHPERGGVSDVMASKISAALTAGRRRCRIPRRTVGEHARLPTSQLSWL